MRIVVTGAAGLIGSAVAALLRRGHDVVGTDLRAGPEVGVLADLRDRAALGRALDGADAVVHVAGLHAPHVGRASDMEFRRTNVEGTDALLRLAASSGIGRFVLTSSTSVYGHALERQSEAAWIDEEVAPQPRDIYDVTKLEAEAAVRSASGPGLRTAILRISRCFPEPARDMAAYRLHRGIDRRDVARAHASALAAACSAARTYVVSAPSPFDRSDCGALAEDAEGLIRERLPEVAATFDARGWPLPRSIGRVYSPARAEAELSFRAAHGVDSVLRGDCDPAPSERLVG